MSSSADVKFSDRLKKAAQYARVEWSQTAIARSLEVSKQTVDRWMGDGEPKPAQVYRIADRWKVSARWLATEEGAMLQETVTGEISDIERDLIARYRGADPRWQLSLRLLAALATEDQLEVATDVNVVIARVLGKKPADVRYASNERVASAFGPAPHVAKRKKEIK